MANPKFVRMGHTALRVKDLAQSLAFYRDIIGCREVWVGDDDWAQVALGPDDLSLVQEGASEHPAHLGFQVKERADLDVLHAKLLKDGVKVAPLKDHRDGTASFYFWDPSGNTLEALWDSRSQQVEGR